MSWIKDLPLEVSAYWRENESERLLIINNLSASSQSLDIAIPELVNTGGVFRDLLQESVTLISQDGILHLVLDPYEFRWLDMQI